jgi:hypothetical protein
MAAGEELTGWEAGCWVFGVLGSVSGMMNGLRGKREKGKWKREKSTRCEAQDWCLLQQYQGAMAVGCFVVEPRAVEQGACGGASLMCL